MTWITDDSGTRWVDIPQPKRRAPAKPKRFAEVKVGDWLMGGPFGRGLDFKGQKPPPVFFLVTDHWFDPVAGQYDAESGMLFAIARLIKLDDKGEPLFQNKWAHTRRGLASQSYHYSDVADPVGTLRAVRDGVASGAVLPLRSRKSLPKGARPL